MEWKIYLNKRTDLEIFEDEYAIFPVKMSTEELEENNRESLIFRPEMFYDFSAMIIIHLLWPENDANYSIIGDDKERALYLAEFLRLGILIFGMIHLHVSFQGSQLLKSQDN